MESDLSLEFLRVTEQAAIACAHTMGQGDRHGSDQVAVEAMRRVTESSFILFLNDKFRTYLYDPLSASFSFADSTSEPFIVPYIKAPVKVKRGPPR